MVVGDAVAADGADAADRGAVLATVCVLRVWLLGSMRPLHCCCEPLMALWRVLLLHIMRWGGS